MDKALQGQFHNMKSCDVQKQECIDAKEMYRIKKRKRGKSNV
jgi:hypothetical protein